MRNRSQLETRFLTIWKKIEGPELVEELKFHPDRKWRFDFAHPSTMVAIEVEGGINFSNSKDVTNAGDNILVSGTTIFKENNGDIKKNIEILKSI